MVIEIGGGEITPVLTGSIHPWPTSSAPAGYLNCDGSAVSRETYSGLFGIIGTTYGAGNGTTTFNLPDLRGRTVIGVGQGAGLSNRTLNAAVGQETVTLDSTQIPAHTHQIAAADDVSESGEQVAIAYADEETTNLETGSAGAGAAHSNMQPSRALLYIIKT